MVAEYFDTASWRIVRWWISEILEGLTATENYAATRYPLADISC
jgi:hypothetical protein